MKVVTAICIKDFTPAPDEDATFVLKRGKEYTLAAEQRDGMVHVFSRYWCWVPAELFAGHLPLSR